APGRRRSPCRRQKHARAAHAGTRAAIEWSQPRNRFTLRRQPHRATDYRGFAKALFEVATGKKRIGHSGLSATAPRSEGARLRKVAFTWRLLFSRRFYRSRHPDCRCPHLKK